MIKKIPDRKTVELTDGNILLRPYRNSDIKEVYRAIRASLKEVGEWLPFAHENYAIKETREWVKALPKFWKEGSQFGFTIIEVKTGEHIGGCGLNGISPEGHRANLGYWVRSDKTGQGIAVTATKLLAKWSFEVLDLKRIEISVAAENARSLRVAEKVGAKKEGVFRNGMSIRGALHDSIMHSLVPGEV